MIERWCHNSQDGFRERRGAEVHGHVEDKLARRGRTSPEEGGSRGFKTILHREAGPPMRE